MADKERLAARRFGPRGAESRFAGVRLPLPLAGTPKVLFERRNHVKRQALVRRVRCEFQEMPGLKLSLAQAARLFDLSRDVCSRVLEELVDRRFLTQTRDGRYALRGQHF